MDDNIWEYPFGDPEDDEDIFGCHVLPGEIAFSRGKKNKVTRVVYFTPG